MLNELNYYIKAGIVVIISGAVFLVNPRGSWVTRAFFGTVPLHLFFIHVAPALGLPELNYFVRSAVVILLGFGIAWWGSGLRQNLPWSERMIVSSSLSLKRVGWALLASLVVVHVLWH